MPKAKTQKPRKPRPDFPLTPHARGKWCKKVGGKLYYFGRWDSPSEALAEYLAIKDELQAGIDPRAENCNRTRATTGEVVNLFLERTDKRVQLGEISPLSFNDYKIIGSLIISHFGRHTEIARIQPNAFAKFRFAMAEKYAPSRLSKIVAVTRMVMKWAYESRVIEHMPIFGPDFGVVSKKQRRIHRAKSERKLFTAAEVLSLIETADAKWKAVLFLCINGGLGNSDISRITLDDVRGEWLDLPRMKTGIERRCPLWPETKKAVKVAIEQRCRPKEGAERLLFLSGHGGPLIKVRHNGKKTDLTIEGFRRIAKRSGVYRPGMGLYWVRHTFQTIADEARDPVATSHVMGHVDNSMAGEYREAISDERLKAVVGHVRDWLFNGKSNG